MTNKPNKRTLSLPFITMSLLSFHSMAFEGLSANIGATNNYLWRGLEQTNGKSAISGGIDYEHASGFYLGTWASNADWADGMTYELDVYGGYTGNIDGINFDVGVIQYAYPDTIDDVDFSEVYASVSFGAFTLGYATLLTAENASFGDDSYISLDASLDVTNDFTLNFHIGRGTDEFYAGEDFTDYSLSLNKSNFTIGASKTDLANQDIKVYISYNLAI